MPYNALEIALPIKDSPGSSFKGRGMVATQLAREVLPGQQGSGVAMSSCQETVKHRRGGGLGDGRRNWPSFPCFASLSTVAYACLQ